MKLFGEPSWPLSVPLTSPMLAVRAPLKANAPCSRFSTYERLIASPWWCILTVYNNGIAHRHKNNFLDLLLFFKILYRWKYYTSVCLLPTHWPLPACPCSPAQATWHLMLEFPSLLLWKPDVSVIILLENWFPLVPISTCCLLYSNLMEHILLFLHKLQERLEKSFWLLLIKEILQIVEGELKWYW